MSIGTDNTLRRERRERRERRLERAESNPRNVWRWRVGPVRDKAATLIDIGVARGTPEFYRVNPDAYLFLIDPIAEFQETFDRVLGNRAGGYEICAVGSSAGEIEIHYYPERPVLTSVVDAQQATDTVVEKRMVPIKPLDDIVDAHKLQPPYGIKIDTEGYELEVIRGAKKTLAQTAFVIAETSLHRRAENSYSFREFIDAMHEAGFAVDNILSAKVGPNGRVPYMDVLYVPA